MNKKKGISAIVATVLIILITVAAVTIIWAAIIPMINKQLGDGTRCLDAVSQVTIKNQGYTYYDTASELVYVQISRGSGDFDLSAVDVIVTEAGNTKTIRNDSVTSLPKINEESVITVTYEATTSDGPTKVEIAPVVKSGERSQVCDKSDALEGLINK